MNLKFNNRLVLYILLIVFRGMLDVFAVYVVFPTYEYAGLGINITFWSAVMSWGYYLSLSTVVCFSSRVIMYYGLIFLFLFLPISSFYFVSSGSLALLTAIFLANVLSFSLSQVRFSFPRLFEGHFYLKALSLGMLTVFVLLFSWSGAWRAFSLDLSRLYSFREEVSSIYTGVFGYLLPWCFKIVIPVFLAMALAQRKYTLSCVLSLVMIFLFFVTFRKEVFVYIVLAWFIGILGLYRRDRLYLSIISSLTFLTIILYPVASLFGKSIYFSYYLHRVFLVIGQNLNDYFVFFSENRKLWFSQSFLRGVVKDPYGEPIPNIIGRGRWGADTEAFANAGIWASGYMQLGYFGIFMYAALLGLVISFLTAAEEKITGEVKRVGAMTAIVAGLLQVVNVDLPSALLTHGLGISILVVWLLSGGSARVYKSTHMVRK